MQNQIYLSAVSGEEMEPGFCIFLRQQESCFKQESLKHLGGKASFQDFTWLFVSSSTYGFHIIKCSLYTKVLLKYNKIECLKLGLSLQIDIRETGKKNVFFRASFLDADLRCYCIPWIKIACEPKKHCLNKAIESEQLQ